MVSASPAANGIRRLSSIVEGRHSASIPTIVPMRAFIGFTNNVAPRKAKMKPKMNLLAFFPR